MAEAPQDQTELTDLEETPDLDSSGGFRLPIWVIAGSFALLALVLFLSIRLFGVVSGLVFPPEPPFPEARTIVTHDNISHGVDAWVYTTSLTPCEVVTFYEANGSACTAATERAWCSGSTFDDPGYPLEAISTCMGTDAFSVFGSRWEADIYTQLAPDATTRRDILTYVDIRRDVLWNGPSPQATTTAVPMILQTATAAAP